MTTNAERWKVAKFTRSTAINAQATKISANRARYEAVSKATGVPWDVIGVIHYRESSGDFAGVLHNGEKIIGKGKKTTLVPKGRGPFTTWEEAALDALNVCPPYAAKNKDWSIAGTLDILERYNGLGYRNKGLPSPYLWAGTDQYVKGKYVADGKFDPNHVDQQLGVAPILLKLRENVKTATVQSDTEAKKSSGLFWMFALIAAVALVVMVVTQVRF
jgi:lysozyme family protein